MAHEVEANWTQAQLLPPCIEDWIGEDHPARFIREFVDELDLDALGFSRGKAGDHGRPGYARELLLRAWLYGYFQKIRSTRKLEEACAENMGFIWLCGTYRPDHNTLWRFWNENRAGLRKLFKQTVRVAVDLKLVGFVCQAVDGTKIQARSGGRLGYDKKSLKTLLKGLDKQIGELEDALKQAQAEGAPDSARLPKELQNKEQLRERVQRALKGVEEGQAKHLHPQEPQTRRMGVDGRNRFGYNAQAVVDEQEQIVVGAKVVNEPTDTGQLNAMIEEAEQTSEQACSQTLADGGYASSEQIRQAQQSGKEVVMPLPKPSQNLSNNPYHASRFEYDPVRDEVICPQGRRIPFQRERLKSGVALRVYRSGRVCKDCPVRRKCTRDRHGRSIDIAPGYEAVKEHRSKMAQVEYQKAYQKRAQVVEPLFAWIKENEGMRRWSFRGLEKVNTQWSMLCGIRNLRVLYQNWKRQWDPSPQPIG